MGHEQQSFRLPSGLTERFNFQMRRLGRKKVEVFRELITDWTEQQEQELDSRHERRAAGAAPEMGLDLTVAAGHYELPARR